MTESKEEYEAPVLNLIGSFEEVTQATNIGHHADAIIQAGGDITGHLTS
jgi:hypothetical protein